MWTFLLPEFPTVASKLGKRYRSIFLKRGSTCGPQFYNFIIGPEKKVSALQGTSMISWAHPLYRTIKRNQERASHSGSQNWLDAIFITGAAFLPPCLLKQTNFAIITIGSNHLSHEGIMLCFSRHIGKPLYFVDSRIWLWCLIVHCRRKVGFLRLL